MLIKINGTTVEKVYEDSRYLYHTIRHDSLSGRLVSVWTDNPDSLFVMSPYGMYTMHAASHGAAKRSWYTNTLLPAMPRRLRGQDGNDLLLVGEFNMIVHYNGRSWHKFHEMTGRANWRSIQFKNNFAVCVGLDYSTTRTVIGMGRRME
ncbi:MAG: hypothetical protein GF313_05535 [Caldithrix sp.]|nr:hypothetical protein [Caldithrix sp.]